MFDKLITWLSVHQITVDRKEIEIFSQHTREVVFPKKTIIMPQGEPVKNLFFLNRGIVRLYRMANATDITIGFVSGNEIISTIVYLLNPVPSPCALETLTEVHTLSWDREDIESLLQKTRLAGDLKEASYKRLLEWNQDREIDTMSLSPEERYLKLLKTQPEVIKEVPLKYIASYLGIHTDSLSRIRKNLSQKSDRSNRTKLV